MQCNEKHAPRPGRGVGEPLRPDAGGPKAGGAVPARAAKFARCVDMLRCPVCGSSMKLAGSDLVCAAGHDFPISKKGAVNVLASGSRGSGDYDRDFFENRRVVFEAGYYDHVVEGVVAALGARPELRGVLDAGCGEGHYAKRVFADDPSRTVVGLDLSKEAVNVAARGGNGVCWIVGDLAALPLRDKTVDAVLDVFSPARYDEFSRVLSPCGLLFKVVPGPRHLQELRHAFKDVIRQEAYSNQLVVDHFERHFELVERAPLTRTVATSPEELRAFVCMTPLLFGVDESIAEGRSVDAITVDAELLVGRPRR